jgi:serine/threonine protein kinase
MDKSTKFVVLDALRMPIDVRVCKGSAHEDRPTRGYQSDGRDRGASRGLESACHERDVFICFQDEEEEIKLEVNVLKKVRVSSVRCETSRSLCCAR